MILFELVTFMKSIIKSFSLFFLPFAAFAANGFDSPDAQVRVRDAMKLAPSGAVEMKGVIGDSLDTSLKGDILVWDIDDLVRPFRTRHEERAWQTEFWGKWYTSAELAYDFNPSPALDKRLKYAAAELIKTQDSEGSITTYKKDHEFKFNETGGLGNEYGSWDLWGRKYVLLGLLNEYARTSDSKVLEAAKKHADYIIKHVGPGKREIVQIGCWYGLASSSILEPMVLLYRATADKKYLDFCEWIVKSWETNPVKPDLVNKAIKGVTVFDMFQHPDTKEDLNNYMSYGHSKAYEMMSCYEGLTELYRVTGNPVYREAVEKVMASIRDREITVLGSGAMHERWSDGAFEQQRVNPYWMETCVTATWIKFATQLLRLTGDPVFANDIETTAYNSMLGAQKHDGSWWAHYNTMSGVRKAAPEQCKMHMNCCVASGPRGLFLLPKLAYMTDSEGVVVNFYEKGGATMPVGDGSVDISVSGVDFAENKFSFPDKLLKDHSYKNLSDFVNTCKTSPYIWAHINVFAYRNYIFSTYMYQDKVHDNIMNLETDSSDSYTELRDDLIWDIKTSQLRSIFYLVSTTDSNAIYTVEPLQLKELIEQQAYTGEDKSIKTNREKVLALPDDANPIILLLK